MAKKKKNDFTGALDALFGLLGLGKPKLKPSANCQGYSEIYYEQQTLKETLENLTDMDLLTLLDDAAQELDLGPKYNQILTRYNKSHELSDKERVFMNELYLLLFSEMGYSLNIYVPQNEI